MRFLVSKQAKIIGGAVFAIVVVVGLAAANGALHLRKPAEAEAVPEHADSAAPTIKLVDNPPHTLLVPEDVRMALGIRKDNADRIAVAKPPKRTRALTMPGSTLLDPTRIYRIRARFAPSPSSAEVIQIGQIADTPKSSPKSPTVFRELRSGDHVIKGNLLAVFYSVDVGNKKNDLIDAIYQLKLDDEILKRAEAKAESVPEVFLLNARRNVQGDRNTIERAVATLKTWGISDEDIQAVRDEAENVKKRDGKRDKAKDAQWARVEIKAPADGVIIERNLSMHEIVVDNTTNLFQIADVSRLFVTANVPEDDLPTLESLSENQRTWTVQTVGSRPLTGSIDDIGYHHRSEPAHGRRQGVHQQRRRQAAGGTIRLGRRRVAAASGRRRNPHRRRCRRWAAIGRLRAAGSAQARVHDAPRRAGAALRHHRLRPQQALHQGRGTDRLPIWSSACFPSSRFLPTSGC